MSDSESFELVLTTKQVGELSRKCGFITSKIDLSVLSLVKLSLAARAAESAVLPLIRNISTAREILTPDNSKLGPKPFSITFELTSEQRRLIEGVVQTDWKYVLILPDEHTNISFTEKWQGDGGPRYIGNSFVIIREGIDYSPEPQKRSIWLPSADNTNRDVFGKGQHPASQLMLVLMEVHIRSNDIVLDVGCGSGILTIGAARLGAQHVVAIDTDEDAVCMTWKAAQLNNLGETVETRNATLRSIDGTFDSIVANLFPYIILDLSPEFPRKMRPGGTLIVSGFVRDRAKQIQEALEQDGFEHIASAESGDWAGIVLKAKARPPG